MGQQASAGVGAGSSLSLTEVVERARARGFTHVLTSGGPVALGEWAPYGGMPGVRFVLRDQSVSDMPPAGSRTGPVIGGVWPLMKPEAAS